MTDNIIYSTDSNDNNLENLTMIDFLTSEGYLQGKELETAKDIIKAFREQKSLSSSINYEKLFVDGGKQDPKWEVIIQANRKWMEFENLLKKQAVFIEKYLCIEKTVEQYKKELGLNFYDVIGKLVMIIQQLTRRLCSDYELLLIELNKQVKAYGFRKTANKLHLGYNTLKRILDGNKNINFKSLEKLIIFFDIEKIER